MAEPGSNSSLGLHLTRECDTSSHTRRAMCYKTGDKTPLSVYMETLRGSTAVG